MLITEQIESRHLAGNLYGDPSTRDLVVYLPPGYERSSRRYPVAYLLHGGGQKAIYWTRPNPAGVFLFPPIDEILDPVFAKRQAAEMIVVMPDGWSRYGCSQWVDTPTNGNFEQYVVREIVPYIDAHYRTIPDAASRGVFGISSGGIGAWHLGSRHPDVFSAMALLSADSHFDFFLRREILEYYTSIYPAEPNGPVAGNVHAGLVYLFAACYSPNPAKPPFYVDLPIEYPTGAIIPEVWAKWLSHDPVVNWRDRVENLRQLRGIFMEVGSRDDFTFHYGHRLLSQGLRSAGIAHESREHDGDHAGHFYRQHQLAAEWLSETLVHAAG